MGVIEWVDGRENLVSPDDADAMVALMAERPDMFEIWRVWESVQSIITVVRRADGTALFGYLMPHPWLSE